MADNHINIGNPSKRINISKQVKIQTNDIIKGDIAVNASGSKENIAEKSRKVAGISESVEVRYLENICSFRNKIQSALSCKHNYCPLIKERLNKHHLEYHPCQNCNHQEANINDIDANKSVTTTNQEPIFNTPENYNTSNTIKTTIAQSNNKEQNCKADDIGSGQASRNDIKSTSREEQRLLSKLIGNDVIRKTKDLCNQVFNDRQIRIQDISVNTEPLTVAHNENRPEHDIIGKWIQSEILDWIMNIKFKETDDNKTTTIINTADFFSNRLKPLLISPGYIKNYKIVIKRVILDTLNELQHILQYPTNRHLYLSSIASELTNRLIYIQVKCRDRGNNSKFPLSKSICQMPMGGKTELKDFLKEGWRDDFNEVQFYSHHKVINYVTQILSEWFNAIPFEDHSYNGEEVYNNNSSDTDCFAETLMGVITKEFVRKRNNNNQNQIQPCYSDTFSVFTSKNKPSRQLNYPVASTPKSKSSKRDLNKQSPEENEYMEEVSIVIRSWIKTLPRKFDVDKDFKQVAIMDLAGDLVDQAKLEQLLPANETDKNKILSYIICRWLYRFDVFDNLSDDMPEIIDLVQRINQLKAPDLARPRYGRRQANANLKIKESDRDFYVPSGIDVLKDEISIWMDKQPSTIYMKTATSNRDKVVHELADAVQKRDNKKQGQPDLDKVITKWLKSVIKSSEIDNLNLLMESLKSKITNLPQDETLRENLHKKIREKLQGETDNKNLAQSGQYDKGILSPKENFNPDRTIKEFIDKYIEYNYDTVDFIAQEAFAELLKTEIKKLSPPTREQVCKNLSKSKNLNISVQRLDSELKYIKIVSDWLKNIPIQSSFNMPHNEKRIEFVNNLAKNIFDVEEERRNNPTAMDYNMYLASIISQFTNELPIISNQHDNVMFMIDELVGKISASRTATPSCQNETTNTTGIPDLNISDFIENYIYLNAGKYVDDQLKMDAWTARLLKMAKEIATSSPDGESCKSRVISQLTTVPIPHDESVKLFGLELSYAREISDWMKNMPLLQNTSDTRAKLVGELAGYISEKDKNVPKSSQDLQNDSNFKEYVTSWIRKVPLEPEREINEPLLIQQLMKRIVRVRENDDTNITADVPVTGSDHVKLKKNSSKINKRRLKVHKSKTFCCGKEVPPDTILIRSIENWSNDLPITGDGTNTESIIKNNVAKKLYQKIGDLSVDPQVANNDVLFEELFTEEVDIQLNDLQEYDEIAKKKEHLKNDLVTNVMEARSNILENDGGNIYKQHLENTIEASIPNPVTNRQPYDPGFEIYKSRLADMFVLQNFDNGIDAVKTRYERRIKNEIDKYFENVQKRNAMPLSNDEMYNELYSALFKVPIPNEVSSVQQVEEIKARCEVDIWFEKLPIREPLDLNELLEWDKILELLTKKLIEIERQEQNPDEKMHKEIAKWIVRFPLVLKKPSDQKPNKICELSDDLINRLKFSKEDRKCTLSVTEKGSKKNKGKGRTSKTKLALDNKSQIPGPSTAGQKWSSPSQPCCQYVPNPKKDPAELILEIVQAWCDQLPFPIETPQDQENNKMMRDTVLTKIIMKICEFNSDPNVFNDDLLYDHVLEAELKKIISDLPLCCEFEYMKDAKQFQLKEAIKSVLPLMREERSRYEYKEELKNTINKVLDDSTDSNTTADMMKLFSDLREEIVDNFVQYHYNRNNDDTKQIHKMKLHELVSIYVYNLKNNLDETSAEQLMRENYLLCELSKVNVPSEGVLKEVVEEVLMKYEVNQFFDHLNLPKAGDEESRLRQNMKVTLARRLNDIEKSGHNCNNQTKMKKEIGRCLKKLNIEITPEKVEEFVDKLKMNEAIRKATPVNTTGISIKDSPKSEIPLQLDKKRLPEIVHRKDSSDACECALSGKGTENHKGFDSNYPAPSSTAHHPSKGNVKCKCSAKPRLISSNSSLASKERPREVPAELERDHMGINQRRREKAMNRNKIRKLAVEKDLKVDSCECGRRLKRAYRGRPRCVLRMENHCEGCEERHTWMMMPYGGPSRSTRRYFYA